MVYIIFELVNSFDLYDQVINNQIDESDKFDYVKFMVESVKQLHDNNVIHNDIKLENMIIDYKYGKKIVKILDFEHSIDLNSKNLSMINSPVTPRYSGPEKICDIYKIDLLTIDESCQKKIDIWGLAFSIYNLFANKNFGPVHSLLKYNKYIADYDFQNFNEPGIPENIVKILKFMFVKNIIERPNIDNVQKYINQILK
jgi:serine/threonine protein kinase